MAKRRTVEPAPVETPELPERLRRCIVENWVSPAGVPPHMTTIVNGRPPTADYVFDALLIRAYGLYRRSLNAWCQEHGVPADHGGPVFRDEERFRSEVRRATAERARQT